MFIHGWDRPVDDAEWQDFVARHRFGELVAAGRDRDLAVVVPTQFVMVDDEVLIHLLAANPIWAAIEENPNVVLAVSGDWAFVPSNWKTIDDEDPVMGIPTTYYGSVQITGAARIVAEPDGVAEVLRTQLAVLQPEVTVADPTDHGARLRAIRALRLTVGEAPSVDPVLGATERQGHAHGLLSRHGALEICRREPAPAAEPRPDGLLATRHAQELRAEGGRHLANGLPRLRAHGDHRDVLGIEVVVELAGVHGSAREQLLHALGETHLRRVRGPLGLLLVLGCYRGCEMVEQCTLGPQHMAQRGPLAGDVAVLGLLHDEVLQQRMAGVVAQQHPVQAHAVAGRAARLRHGRRGDRAQPLLPVLDRHEAVVHRLGDRRACARDVLGVLAEGRVIAGLLEAREDRLLEL